jgi:hypothetical protein
MQMKRWIVVMSALIVALAVSTVQAQPSSDDRVIAVEVSDASDVFSLRDVPTRIRPPTCDLGDPQQVYQRCLDRYLTSLARQVDRALGQLNDYIDNCLRYVELGLYGDPTAGHGYVYDLGDGTSILTSALQPLVNADDIVYANFATLRNSCVTT